MLLIQVAIQGSHRGEGIVMDLQGGGAAVDVGEKKELSVHIRWMRRRDMLEVLDIEGLSFECRWTEDDFVRCLSQWNCINMVAEHVDQVVGFMIYELDKMPFHLLNFAVYPGFRRQQVGTQMLNQLIARLLPELRTRILLEVRERNLPAQMFFRSSGFRAISVLRNFYEDTVEDAYLMEYVIKEKGL